MTWITTIMITHLQENILKLKSSGPEEALLPPKLVEVMVFQLFKILNDDAVKVHSICQQVWKTQHWPQNCKRSVFIPIPKKGNTKECSNYCIIVLISHASKVMFKILQVQLQQYMNRELPDIQAGFRKGRGNRDQIAICWITKKAREFQKRKKEKPI